MKKISLLLFSVCLFTAFTGTAMARGGPGGFHGGGPPRGGFHGGGWNHRHGGGGGAFVGGLVGGLVGGAIIGGMNNNYGYSYSYNQMPPPPPLPPAGITTCYMNGFGQNICTQQMPYTTTYIAPYQQSYSYQYGY